MLSTLSLLAAEASSAFAAEAAEAPAKPTAPLYFHNDVDYGSDSEFNPLQATIHLSYDILRNASYQDSPFKLAYGAGFENVAKNLVSPFDAIAKSGGTAEFIGREVFPIKGINTAHGQWVPNYTLHVLGEGMVYRKLWSWYASRQVPVPWLFGLLNTAAAQFVNEVAENGDFHGANTDPVADFWIFNPIGYALFSIDPVARFFSTTVRLNFWPQQATLDVLHGKLLNTGGNYSFKFPLPKTEWKAFYYTGTNGLFGATIPLKHGNAVSVAFGTSLYAIRPIYTEQGGRIVVPDDLEYAIGAFWDRDESLMASFQLVGPQHITALANLYPGLLRVAGFSFGLYSSAGYYDGFGMGLSMSWLPLGPGFAVGTRTSQEWL
ncbi:MAG TPA: hypothetical protein VIW29_03330 [Polyangiaceae bacterium]